MRSKLAIILCWASMSTACGSAGLTFKDIGSPAPDVPGEESAVVDAVEDAVELPAPEVAPEDVQELSADLELTPACEPGTGCFLDKCQSNDECQSGWCVEHLGDGVCTQTCVEECPPGWDCRQIADANPDLVYACVSVYANLCRPCQASTECKSVGGAEDVCVSYGSEGSFCGGKCEATLECPWGFSCKKVQSVDGIETLQCVADAGVCPCTQKSVDLALWTPCAASNEHGTCEGKRVCTGEGLTDCDAGVPAGESCNGLDDDCDGEVDEAPSVEGQYVNLCDDGNECTKDACKGEAGCENLALDEGECKDGDVCTVGDHCAAGECIGLPSVCDDNDPCTDDSCDGLGGCKAEFNTAKCDDGDPCTVADQCEQGVCAGVAVDCDCTVDTDCAALDDGDVCNGVLFCDTTGVPFGCAEVPGSVVSCPEATGKDAACLAPTCDPLSGKCGLEPDNEGFACDDGDPCTVGDQCVQGQCVSGVKANCADENPCTDDYCVAFAGCQHTGNAKACSDGDVCTVGDVCQDGACLPGKALACDDGNPCTDDACDPATGCGHAANQAPCDDGNACTTLDACLGGLCFGSGSTSCDDGNLCTDDACDPAVGCAHSINTVPCSDGDVCTVNDTCSLGQCKPGTPLPCKDNNPCTDDSCNPKVGCEFKPNVAACTDGSVCTQGDVCSQGWCKPGPALACDDGNFCTTDSCDPEAGCTHVNNSFACSDSNACTVNDQCGGGACIPGPKADCDDKNACTSDSCDPAKGCVNAPASGPCDDGNKCTSGETCLDAACQGGAPVVCNDSNICTDDACDPKSGCVFTPNIAGCTDGSACSVGDVCSNGACKAGAPLACDDLNVCTTDSCDPKSGCVFTPVADGTGCGGTKTCLAGQCVDCGQLHGSTAFAYTGGAQTFTVPACITSVHIDAYGGQGGSNGQAVAGSLGGRAQGDLTVTPGQVLNVYVGGSGNSGGWNGGGDVPGNYPAGSGSHGGGASDVRAGGTALSNRVIVAGGAGGHAAYSFGYGGWTGGVGGIGGGSSGTAGTASIGNNPPAGGGGGGTQGSGGAAGNNGNPCCSWIDATAGSLGQGGNAGGEADGDTCGSAGAGGGGYFGGGGGGHHNCGGGGGGGGSSYTGGVANGSTEAGVGSGNGKVTISW